MYFEEVDLCYRLARAGWEVHFAPAAEVIHLGGASTKQNRLLMSLQFFASLKHFYERHYSPFRKAQLFLVVTSTALARMVKDRIRLFFTRDAQERSELAFQLQVWQRLLLGN
jgi:GT2 family glycosyltransferase